MSVFFGHFDINQWKFFYLSAKAKAFAGCKSEKYNVCVCAFIGK